MIASSSHNAYTRGTGTAVCARERITRYSAVDCVSAWQQMAKGLAPQNIRSGSGDELVSRVGLAALEPLGSERATEPGDAIAHPPFEPTEGQIIPLPADRCPTSGKPPVADCHLMPHGLVTLGEKLVPDPLVHRNTSSVRDRMHPGPFRFATTRIATRTGKPV